MKIVFIAQIILILTDVILNFLKCTDEKKIRLYSVTARMLLSLSFIISALCVLMYNKNYRYSLFVFSGTFFSFAGDIVMASIVKCRDRIKGGIVFFSIMHMLYIAAYVSQIIKSSTCAYDFLYLSALYLIAIAILYIILKVKKKLNGIFFIFYGTVIITMSLCALGLAMFVKGPWILTFSSSLIFILSDSIIAIGDNIKLSAKKRDVLIWITYTAAQMGIIYSAAL